MAEFIVLERQFKIRQTPGDILSTVLSDNSVYIFKYTYADMAELADAPDLGSGVLRRAGSSPVIRTTEKGT